MSDIVETIRSRIGSEFDGECHLTEDEANEAADLVTRLRSELASARAAEWQPIGTAPIDGTRFLAGHEKSGVVAISWYGKTSHVPLYGWCHGDDPEDIDLWKPTHWQPLPAIRARAQDGR